MSAVEWIATLMGIACVTLAAQRSVWTFPAGIASVTLLGIVVFEARLYSDALLQAFFVAANLYGWRNWSRAAAPGEAVPVRWMPPRARVVWLAGIAGAAAIWGGAMHVLTDASYPWWDAGIAAASIAAQLMMARRRVDNWMLWIAVDMASVPLYLAKGLHLFAALYVVYLALAVWGLLRWLGAVRGAGANGAPVAA